MLAAILSRSMVWSKSISLSRVSFRALFRCSSLSDLFVLIFYNSETRQIYNYFLFYLEFIVQNFKILLGFGVSPSFNFLFMFHFFIFSSLFIHFLVSLIFILFMLLETISPFASKPTSGQSLNKKSSLISSLLPHVWVKVHLRFHGFIGSGIQEESLFFHLGSNFPFDFGWLTNPFIGLSFPCEA